MAALIKDLATGHLSVAEAQAHANLVGKLTKLVEMRLRYGQWVKELGMKDIVIFADEVEKSLGVPVPRPSPAAGSPPEGGAAENN